MPMLQVRELPVQIYEKLKQEAEKEHRSLSQQATISLARGLEAELNPGEKRVLALKKLQLIKDKTTQYQLSDPAELIRKDRER